MANFNFNKVIIGGKLTADPELKTTQSGISVTSFTVAVNRKVKSGDEQKADFITVVAWRGTAEFICKYFHKASSITIVGSLQTRNWTDDNGNKRYVTEVVAEEAYFVDSRSENAGNPSINTMGEQKPTYNANNEINPYNGTPVGFEEVELDENLPF